MGLSFTKRESRLQNKILNYKTGLLEYKRDSRLAIYHKEKTHKKEKIKNKQSRVLFVIVVVIVIVLIGSTAVKKFGENDVITSSQLEKAIDIDELSTAEFVYNGVAEKYNDDKPEEVDFYIAYEANVKVGIQMGEVKFDIDEDNKTVKPLLPELSVNIVTPNTESLSYIPKDPDIPLKEIIALCEKDAMNEANNSEELYETAEQNLQAVIEALLSPILDHAEYSVVW